MLFQYSARLHLGLLGLRLILNVSRTVHRRVIGAKPVSSDKPSPHGSLTKPPAGWEYHGSGCMAGGELNTSLADILKYNTLAYIYIWN